LPLLSIPPAVL